MLGKNLKMIREIWGLSQFEFGYLVGASRGMIMQYENRGTTPKSLVFRNIVQETGFTKDILMNTEINPEDVEGMSMSQRMAIDNIIYEDDKIDTNDTDELIKARPGKGATKTPNPRIEAKPAGLASDPNEQYPDRFTHLGDGTIAMRIPIIKQRAYAGYLRGFADPEYYEDLPTMTIDVLLEHKGNYLAFEVVGDSMTTLEPGRFKESIFDGTYVVGRELQQHHWKYKLHTHSFDNWVIVHKTEGILVKKIIAHDVDKGIITINSLNPDRESYPDQDLELNDVQQIFNVVQTVNKL